MSKICNSCGHENDSDRQKCAYCSRPLSGLTRQKAVRITYLSTLLVGVISMYFTWLPTNGNLLFPFIIGVYVAMCYFMLMMYLAIMITGETNE